MLLPALEEPLSTVAGVFTQRSPGMHEEEWASVLRSHSISPESDTLLSIGEVVGFLQARQKDVQGALESFLRRKCE